jgi:alkylhydroperoxidase family enzyme
VAAHLRFHKYFHKHHSPTLAVWGKNDPFFPPQGAEAFRGNNPNAEVHFVDAGHFPLEAHLDEIARIIRAFLTLTLDTAQGPALFGNVKSSAPAEAKQLLDDLAEVFGFIPNLGYALAVKPSVLSAYIMILQSLGATTLDPVAQQVALASASYANGADYGDAVHATLAAKVGAPGDVVEALRNGRPLTDPKLEAVRRFADAIVSKRTQVSDSDVEVHVLDAGHFALDTKAEEIATLVHQFIAANVEADTPSLAR